MKKLNKNDIKEIIKLYQTEIPSTHKLAKRFKVGHRKISNILKDNNIPINNRGRQKTINNSVEIEKSKVLKYKSKKINTKLVAVCIKTGVSFEDVNNLSGVLTKHIIDNYGNVKIPNNTYQRKKYEKQYGRKWFEEYFIIKEIKLNEKRKCGLCEWETTDINNKTGCFEKHINEEHNINISEYLLRFPNEIKFHSNYEKKLNRNNYLNNKNNSVKCELCGEKMKVITNSHLKNKHNITQKEYKLKFPNSKLLSNTSYNIFNKNRKNININVKPKWTSKAEIEILDFLTSNGINVEKYRNRGLLNGSELDLVLPDYNLAIEYNGLYWHTESKGKNSTYHINKTKKCNEIGYSLIHIFEDEWENKKELIKYKLKHILNISEGFRIGARKCTIKEISNKDKNLFLNKYHIQGTDKSKILIGAFYDNKLVAVMTFNDNRNMTSNENLIFELSRFATNYNYILPGLSSKMLNYFIKKYNPNSVISFADRRWTLNANNNMYIKLGFNLVDILKPSYSYYNSNVNRLKRFHKFGFGKNSLKKKYPNLDFNKTEKELTSELGYDRIWDCGLFKYELNLL
jgi:hypothetical protein